MNPPIKHDDWLGQRLEDPAFAAEYIMAAVEDDDPATYLTALRKVVEAHGGMANLASKTALSRETLYRTLSDHGNPTLRTLDSILRAMGMRLSVEPATFDRD